MRSSHRLRLAGASLALLALVGGGCGGDDSGGSTSTTRVLGANETEVVLKNIAFIPDTVTVDVGGTVVWRWDDGAIQHNVVFDAFASKLFAKGEFSHTFDQAGTFAYKCTVHPQMTGKVIVG